MRIYPFIILFFILVGCAQVQDSSLIYKHEVQQGNEIDFKMFLKLKPDMTKAQVKFVLGTPLIQDSFHKDRWDYIFVLRQEGREVERRHIILNFDKDLLKSITGEVIPSQGSSSELQEAPKTYEVTPDKQKTDEDESWTDSLKFWEDDEPVIEENKKTQPVESKTITEPKPELVEKKVDEPKIEKKLTEEPIGEDEGSWLDSLKFWEDEEEISPAKTNPIKSKEVDEISTEKVMPQKVEEIEVEKAPVETQKDYVDEMLEIDSSESINKNIQEDLSMDDIEKIEDVKNNEPMNEAIIEEKSNGDQDYFDLMLEKIGF